MGCPGFLKWLKWGVLGSSEVAQVGCPGYFRTGGSSGVSWVATSVWHRNAYRLYRTLLSALILLYPPHLRTFLPTSPPSWYKFKFWGSEHHFGNNSTPRRSQKLSISTFGIFFHALSREMGPKAQILQNYCFYNFGVGTLMVR